MAAVFIIGGARRLGGALAVGLATRGFDVGFTWHSNEARAISTETRIHEQGVAVAMARANVADPSEIARALETLASKLGHPHAIVVNAGVFPPPTSVPNLSEEDIVDTFRVNTVPLVTVAKWIYSTSIVSGTIGRVVSIGSLGADQIWKDRLAYNVSKAALATTMRSLARSCAPHVVINGVAPGTIIIPEDPSPNDAHAVSTESIPMRRHGVADDVLDAVGYFISASTYVTGQILRVDGGHNLARNI